MYNKNITLVEFAKTATRASWAEFIELKNLLMIAERNNWPHAIAMLIFPSNR
jgi:hypothetical protein